MKKIVALVGLLLGLSSVSYAGTPMETYFSGQSGLSNTTVIGSTASTVGTANLVAAIAPVAGAGAASSTCRVCLTKFLVQIETMTVVSILDGATTGYTILGAGLGTTGTNTLALPEDHLGPYCASAGNTLTINSITTNGITANPQAISYEGYTNCGGTANKGSMQ